MRVQIANATFFFLRDPFVVVVIYSGIPTWPRDILIFFLGTRENSIQTSIITFVYHNSNLIQFHTKCTGNIKYCLAELALYCADL